MPVLRVQGLPQRDPERIPAALQAACRAMAEAWGCELRHCWATWDEIAPGRYAEGAAFADIQPDDSHPPMGELICFEGATPERIAATLEATGAALSEALGIPGNVFLRYVEAKSGQVVDGAGIVRR